MSSYSQAIDLAERSRPVGPGAQVSFFAAALVPSLGSAIFAVTLLHVLFLSGGTRTLFRDSDAGWHIRNGEAILSTMSVPRADRFSFVSTGRPWLAWEWASDVLLGGAHRLAGPAGVAFLAALVIALTAWGASRLALSLGGNLFFTAVAAVLLLGATSIHWLARPHILSWLLSLIFLAIAEHERDVGATRRVAPTGTSRSLYWLPALACLWANLHGSFLLGPGILFVYAVGEGIRAAMGIRGAMGTAPSFVTAPDGAAESSPRREPWVKITLKHKAPAGAADLFGAGKRNSSAPPGANEPTAIPTHGSRHGLDSSAPAGAVGTRFLKFWSSPQFRSTRRFAGLCVASLAATFINPYGWQLHLHIISYLRDTYLMDHIAEFRSFSFHAPGAIYVELFLVVAILGVLALVRQRAYGPAILGIVLLHFSLYSARYFPEAAVLLLPLSVAALTREAERLPRFRSFIHYSQRVRAIDRNVRGLVPVMLVLVLTGVALMPLAQAGRVGFDPDRFPVGAADYLEQRGVRSRVFAKDQWGGYLIYRFDGRLKVFLDGRSDYYGRQLLETYARVMEVQPGWDAVLRQFGVQFVLAPPDHALASVLALSPEWKRVYTDRTATVFERIG